MTDAPSSTPTDVPPASGRRASLKWWLIASVTVNLLLLGLVGGGMVAFRHHGGGPFGGGMRGAAGGDFGLLSFARTLPEERRQAIKKDLRQARARLKPHLESISAARDKAAGFLASDPFDATALKSALDGVQGEEMKLRSEGITIFIEEASKLSPDERQSLAEMWKKHRGRRGPKPDDDEK